MQSKHTQAILVNWHRKTLKSKHMKQIINKTKAHKVGWLQAEVKYSKDSIV